MKLRSLALTTALATTLALPVYALGVGGAADGAAGADAGVGGVGADAGADADAGASVGTDGSSVGAEADADADASASVDGTSSTGDDSDSDSDTADSSDEDDEGSTTSTTASVDATGELNAAVAAGASVLSSDGEVIGQISGMRTDAKDGSTQAVIDLATDLRGTLSKVAVEAQNLSTQADGQLSYGMTKAELKSHLSASASGTARTGSSE